MCTDHRGPYYGVCLQAGFESLEGKLEALKVGFDLSFLRGRPRGEPK